MSIEARYEREERDITDRYNSGEISLKDYNSELRDLMREARACAEEAAEEAYNREMNNW